MNTDETSLRRAISSPPNVPANPLPFTRVDVALLLLLGVLVALFFWRILTPNLADRAQFPAGDFTDQFYAFRLYEARALAQGRIPLWSENFNSGHPFLADIQSAVFYPIALANTLLNLALFKSQGGAVPFSLFALELEALLHFYLAGAFTYLFARRVIKHRIGAFTTASVFTFGGYLTSYPSLQLAILETAVWLPLALWCLDHALNRPVTTISTATEADPSSVIGHPSSVVNPPSFVIRPLSFVNPPSSATRYSTLSPQSSSLIPHPSWLIAAGFVLGVAALAGHPQTFLFVVSVALLYLLWQLLARVSRFSSSVSRLGSSFILHPSSFIPLPILAPVALTVLIAFGIAAVQLIPAIEYQQLSTREALSFADAARGLPTLDLLQFILPGYASAFASPLYLGILPLWLAVFALLRRPVSDGRPEHISERAFWGLLALGALILSLGFYVFAYVIFYLLVPGASLFRQQERLAFVVSFALALLAGYGITDLIQGLNAKRANKLYALLPVGAALMLALMLTFFVARVQDPQGRLAFLGDRAGLMLVLFGLASLLLGLYLRRIAPTRWFAPLAILLVLFDLWSVNETANKGHVEDRFADIPFAAQLQNDPEIFRVAADEQLLPGHFGIPTRLEEIGGISPLRLARYDALLNLPPELVLPLLNVKYVITQGALTGRGELVERDGKVQLWRRYDAQPRAWMVGSAVAEPDDAQAAAILQNSFDPAQRLVIAVQSLPLVPDARAAGSTVSIVARDAERLAMDVNTPADGFLVVSENFYPGWRATIDGSDTEILRADLTLRALPVRAGQHHIEMWYDPFSFKLGAAISGLTLLLSAAALVLWWSRK